MRRIRLDMLRKIAVFEFSKKYSKIFKTFDF